VAPRRPQDRLDLCLGAATVDEAYDLPFVELAPKVIEDLSPIVLQRVVVRDRRLEAIEWTPAARPFFEKRQWECPQGDSNP
jgi:hypothetical protein